MIGERLHIIKENLRMDGKELEKKLHLEKGDWAGLEADKTQPPQGMLEKLAADFNVNLNWLLAGKGEMFLSEAADVSNPNIVYVDLLSASVSAGRGAEDFEVDVVRKIPVLNEMIAPYSPQKVKALTVRGDSMVPTVYDSDIVFYVPKLLEYNGIYVIRCFSELLCKRLDFRLSGKVAVISDNKHYQKQEFPKESDVLSIVGKVIGWSHRHR